MVTIFNNAIEQPAINHALRRIYLTKRQRQAYALV
jgi:hypothetical protein